MNKVRLILLYTCIVFSANTVNANVSNLLALTNNDLGKIRFHSEPKPLNFATFENITNKEITVSDFKGKFILLNFWALWCAPCVEEMPALDNLKAFLQDESFDVIAVATGRNDKDKVNNFFETNNLTFLNQFFDPKSLFSRQFNIKVLPTTLMIDSQGREVGRVEGTIAWDSLEAQKLFREWIKIR